MGSCQLTVDTVDRMKLIIRDKSSDVTEWAAKYVIKRINSFNPGPNRMFVLGLPTGGTPLGMYQKLVQAHKAGKISFKYVITFNMDEYVGIANARFFGGDINLVPKQALTVGVGTVMDAREVMVLITGANKSIALYKAIEEGVCHMWTVSA